MNEEISQIPKTPCTPKSHVGFALILCFIGSQIWQPNLPIFRKLWGFSLDLEKFLGFFAISPK